MILLALPLSIAVSFFLWAWIGFRDIFALPILVILGWLLLRYSVSPEGTRQLHVTANAGGRSLLFFFGTITACLCLMFGFLVFVPKGSILLYVPFAALFATLPPVYYFMYKAIKQQRIAEEQAAELAPALWQQGECAAS
jgi:hypothetical protein